MKTYESMKLTSIKWLGMIPKHWEVIKNKHFLSERDEKTAIGNEELLSLSQYTGISIKGQKANKTGMHEAESLVGYKVVHKNDIVMNIMLAWNGSTAKSKYNGIISPAYAVYHVMDNSISPDYLHYLFKTPQYMRYFENFSTGIIKSRLRLYPQSFLHLFTIIPPREEQDQIVRFLDWKVSEINTLINIKYQSIKTLKELMYAEIEKQLTVYPIAENVRLKQIGSFFKGGGFSRDNIVDDTRCPAILYGDIYTKYEYKTSQVSHYIDADAYTVSRKITKGDIVMAGTGETKDEIGKPILYTGDEKVAVGGDVIVFSPNDNVNAEYILYQLYSQASLKHRYINGKGDIIVHIYPTALGNTTISLPSIEDQKKAVIAINNIIDSVHETMDKLEREVAVLKEFSVRMISDVVTGKIDVRGIEIPKYEYISEEIDEMMKDKIDDTEEELNEE